MSKKNIFLILFIVIIIVVTAIIITMNDKGKSTIQNSLNITEEYNNYTTNNISDINNSVEEKDNMKLYIRVNNETLTATLENNASVHELLEKLNKQDITINMQDYANFEKVGALGFDLPRNDKQITTEAGDIILYQGNQFVIYYDTNNWSFTKLGHIDNINQDELKQILGKGNVTITLSLERN